MRGLFDLFVDAAKIYTKTFMEHHSHHGGVSHTQGTIGQNSMNYIRAYAALAVCVGGGRVYACAHTQVHTLVKSERKAMQVASVMLEGAMSAHWSKYIILASSTEIVVLHHNAVPTTLHNMPTH